jgi:hypothetical protein
LSIIFADGHHAEIAVDVEDEDDESSYGFVVQITAENLDDGVDDEEKEINSLGVDPVGQILDFVLEKNGRLLVTLMIFERLFTSTVSRILKSL